MARMSVSPETFYKNTMNDIHSKYWPDQNIRPLSKQDARRQVGEIALCNDHSKSGGDTLAEYRENTLIGKQDY